MKKFGGALAKGAVRLAPSQRDEGSDYILQLKSLFDESQFIGMLLYYYYFSIHYFPVINSMCRGMDDPFPEGKQYNCVTATAQSMRVFHECSLPIRVA